MVLVANRTSLSGDFVLKWRHFALSPCRSSLACGTKPLFILHWDSGHIPCRALRVYTCLDNLGVSRGRHVLHIGYDFIGPDPDLLVSLQNIRGCPLFSKYVFQLLVSYSI